MIKCEECIHNKLCKYTENKPKKEEVLEYPFELEVRCKLFHPYAKRQEGFRYASGQSSNENSEGNSRLL